MSEYSSDWKEIAFIIKQNAHFHCQNCGHGHDPQHGYTLGVHHLDSNKGNNHASNLVALCQRCHLHYQGRPNTHQLSFFPLPDWLQRYQSLLQSKSKPLKIKSSPLLPG